MFEENRGLISTNHLFLLTTNEMIKETVIIKYYHLLGSIVDSTSIDSRFQISE